MSEAVYLGVPLLVLSGCTAVLRAIWAFYRGREIQIGKVVFTFAWGVYSVVIVSLALLGVIR